MRDTAFGLNITCRPSKLLVAQMFRPKFGITCRFEVCRFEVCFHQFAIKNMYSAS